MKKMLSWGSRTVIAGVVCLVASAGFASSRPHDDPRHRSSLHATVTMTDGTARTVTLQGVGCSESMCSKVRAQDINADPVWLDGIVSVREISHNAEGPVRATLTFRDGAERQVSITRWNRVLYVQGRLWGTEKLDLGHLTRVVFE